MSTAAAESRSVQEEKRWRKDLVDWLRQEARAAGRWPGLAVAAGVTQTLAMVAQSAVLAWMLHALVIAGLEFARLWGWGLGFLGLAGLRALAGWCREMAGAEASRRVRSAVRLRLIAHIHGLGPGWRRGQQGGALSTLLLEQVDSLDAFIARFLPQRRIAAIAPALVAAAVFPFSWVCGLLLLATAPLVPLFMVLIGWSAQDAQARQLSALARMGGHFLDRLRGLGTLRLLDAHRSQGGQIAAMADGFRQRTMAVLRIAFLSSAALEFFTTLSIALSAVFLGFSMLGLLEFAPASGIPALAAAAPGSTGFDPALRTVQSALGGINLFSALFILFLAPEFYLPLRELGAQYHARAEALAAAARIRALLEDPGPQPSGGQQPPPGGPPRIRFEDLGFAYPGGPRILDGCRLDLMPGEALAIVGESGAGKTTLLRLLLGQLRPDGGRILIGDGDLAHLDLDLWRESVAWMSQHPRVLSASLADNLRLARQGASDAELRAALDFAGLGSWFAALPDGLDSRLGEGGRQLSGGQLRRLALARVRLRPSGLLLLDEPTASLDADSEEQVVAGLAQLRRDRSLILFSHRERTRGLADRTMRLENGRLVP